MCLLKNMEMLLCIVCVQQSRNDEVEHIIELLIVWENQKRPMYWT